MTIEDAVREAYAAGYADGHRNALRETQDAALARPPVQAHRGDAVKTTEAVEVQLCDDCGQDQNWCTCTYADCGHLVLDCLCDETPAKPTEETL